jgi:enoyl-CoA hydratase/3-hydroxyacyl-CoA dehydrogenase
MGAARNPLLEVSARPLPARFAVIGAGTIGPDIGYYLKSTLPELELVLIDVAQTALDRALARFDAYAKKAVARDKMKEAAALTRGIAASTDSALLGGGH